MEQTDILDPLNERHLYALHVCTSYKPGSIGFHERMEPPLNSKCTSKSPHQLFAAGALLLQHSGLAALDFFDDVDDTYGIGVDAPVPDQHGSVEVPEVRFAF